MHRTAGRRVRGISWVAGALLILAAPGVTAQKKAQELSPLVEEVQVEVVNVDVVVTDRSGRPVSGLTAEDFVVYEEGKERQISNFFSFTDGDLKLPPAQQQEVEWQDTNLQRRMVILFDMNSLEKAELERATEDFEQFVLEQFDGSYEWSVVAYKDELRMMQPFTIDKTTVIGALARTRDIPLPIRRTRATDPAFSENPVVASRVQAFGRASGLDRSAANRLSAEDFEIRERMLLGLKRFDHTARAIVETMRAYSALPGRKSLVLVTGSIETLPSGPQLLGFGLPGLGGGERADPMVQTLFMDLQQRTGAIVKMANASGFAIYPVSDKDAQRETGSTLDVSREASVAFLQAGTSRNLSNLDTSTTQKVLAAGTGGIYYTSKDFYKSVDDIDHRTANAYVLGFQTTHAPEQDYHRIEVRVKKPGVQVKSREGYLHLSRRDRLAEELATPLLFPKARGDFAVEVQVMPPDKITKKAVDVTVAGVIPIDNLTLIPQGKMMVGRIFLLLAVYDREGNLHKMVREDQDLRLTAERLAGFPAGAPARFGLKVKGLERGEYTFTLRLMDEVSDRYGTGFQPVQL